VLNTLPAAKFAKAMKHGWCIKPRRHRPGSGVTS